VSDEAFYAEDEIEIKSYIFRPIFGILLAIATFVISISINGLTSTGKIEDLQTGTILFLAFAAGLLSDKTYEMITEQTEQAVNKRDNSNTQKTEAENTEQAVSKLNNSNAQKTEAENDKIGQKNKELISSHSPNNGAKTD
jgi:hypothetical protein